MSANHPGDADTRDSPPLAHARERQRSDSAVLQQRREWVQSAGNAGSGGFSPTGSGSMQPPLPLLNHNHAHVITAANVAPRSSSLTAGSHSPDQGNLQNQAQQPSQSTFTRLKNLVFSSGSKSLSQGNIPNDTTLLDPQNSMLALQQGPPGGAPTSKTSIADLFKRSNSNVSPNAALSPTGSTYGSTLDPNTLLGQKSSSTRGGIFRSHSGSNVEVVSDSQTPRSRRGSLNSSTPMSRSGSATAIDLPPGAAETEGLVFGASIADAASRAGKNGIPDIVIQCVEYLERKGFLETEGLYRVPGSIKRVKEWTAKFDSLGQSLGSTYSQKSQHQAENGINQAPIMKFANIRQKTNESMRSLNTTSPSGLQPSTSALSLLAFSGSASIKGSTFAVAENSVTPNLVTPILILDSDHAKIGDKSHGLWGNDGCASTLGFPVLLEVDTAPTIASLLKKYLASVKGKFAPPGMWDELDKIAMGESGVICVFMQSKLQNKT
ncbi:hypothetical protein BC830DRAFT_1159267 [Chytriomyces sp. MP71]|nr:hypothetical protein BC830DRAFT_1159267 [Chytriomyces sp. MP71]